MSCIKIELAICEFRLFSILIKIFQILAIYYSRIYNTLSYCIFLIRFSCHLYLVRKEECDVKPHSSEFLKKEFSAGCQPQYPVKIPIATWKSLSPPRGLQLFPSCQAQCPVKTSNEMENYPAPSAAQLLTMLLHREHFCSYLILYSVQRKNQPKLVDSRDNA